MGLKTSDMFAPVPTQTTAASDAWTLSGGPTTVPYYVTSRLSLTCPQSFQLSVSFAATLGSSITIPWDFAISTTRTLTLQQNTSASVQKLVWTGAFSTAGTARVAISGGYQVFNPSTPITFLDVFSSALVEVSAAAMASSGTTISLNGSTFRWATGNTTDYSAAAYTKTYASGTIGWDPNGQTITLGTALAMGVRPLSFGPITSTSTLQNVNGTGRIKLSGNGTGSGGATLKPGCVVELNGSAVTASSTWNVSSGSGTSATMYCGLEGTGTATSIDVTIDSDANKKTHIAGGVAGTNGTLTVHNITFSGANASLRVFSDGTTNNCSKVACTDYTAGGHSIELADPMAAGTYTLLTYSGTGTGTQPTVDATRNNSGRTVSSCAYASGSLVLILI